MADSVGSKVSESFDNSSTGGAVSNCCKVVKGEWKEIPKAYPNGMPEYLGNPKASATYYFDTIPKGVRYSAKLRHHWKVKGRLVCKCMDDGRTLSDSPFEKDVTFDAQTPVFQQNLTKKLLPGWMGLASLAYDAYKIGKLGYDIYSQNPELAKQLAKDAGPAAEKALDEVKNSADTLCKSKHKPCNDADPKPGPPGKPGPGEGDGPPLVS